MYVMYPDIINAIIIIPIIMILTFSPVFMFTTIVASDTLSFGFTSSSCPSICALLVLEPKLISSFVHLSVTFKSLLSPTSSSTSVCSVPSVLVVQYSGASNTSYPSGIVSSTVIFPSISPLFCTFML